MKITSNRIIRIFIMTVLTFGISSLVLSYPRELIKASLCTNAGIHNEIYSYYGKFTAACTNGPPDFYFFHMIGGIALGILAIEFFYFFNFCKLNRLLAIVSLSIAIYQFVYASTETLLFDAYVQHPYLLDITSLVAVLFCIVISDYKLRTPSKRREWLWISILIVVTVSLIAILIMYNLYYIPGTTPNLYDVPNWLALNLTITFGIIITLITYYFQRKNEKKLTDTLKDIASMVRSEHLSYEERRESINKIISGVFNEIESRITEILSDIDKLKNTKDQMSINILQAKIHVMQNKISEIIVDRFDISINNAETFFRADQITNFNKVSELCKKPLKFNNNIADKYADYLALKDIISYMKEQLNYP